MPDDPFRTAGDLWNRLVGHQPAVAAALALKLRELPDDWTMRELGLVRPEAALALPSSDPEHRVEIEPSDAGDWENCPACGEAADDFCRYHRGYTAGYEALHQPLLDAITIDTDVTVRVALQRVADEEDASADGVPVGTVSAASPAAQPAPSSPHPSTSQTRWTQHPRPSTEGLVAKIRLPWMSRADRRLWRSADSLQDLGDRVALWLTGAVASQAGYQPRYGPDPETAHLIPVLARLNRSGLITDCSQPGIETTEPDGTHWSQRAAVTGLGADTGLLRRLALSARDAGLWGIVHTAATPGAGRDGVIVTTVDGEPYTQFGAHMDRQVLETIWPPNQIGPGAHEGVLSSWQLTIVDPQYGRDDVLWPFLSEICDDVEADRIA
ncbi:MULTISPECIES: hypothetical protein [unclassified Streptomyces]|uniref:DUF6919 domain-containing protein n=1 Tax=unclassified Streptomyces TaxID=2593676 RepID=UPI000DC76AD5|nr:MULTISPECIES: hypothetical protein [unclassified Streptomyces]AWZ06878.1 hypothetical protein DRB89_22185 [Streptomyces sp. ICC4]AWZ14543.1 hypothetical protein DRB96_22345 [Streptomyces sp. ICC1]